MAYYNRPSAVVGSSFGRPTTITFPNDWRPDRVYPLYVMYCPYGDSPVTIAARFASTDAQNYDDGCFTMFPAQVNSFAGTVFWDYYDAPGGSLTSPATVDDFVYNAAIIAEAKAKLNIGKVKAAGYSNGGYLALQMSTQYPGLFSAIATHSCAFGTNDSGAPTGFPLAHAHFIGDGDGTVNPAGDPSATTLPGPLVGHGGVGSPGYLSAVATVALSNSRNGGAGSLGATYDTIDYLSTVVGSETTRQAYSGTTAATAVELWTGVGVGHTITLNTNKGRDYLVPWLMTHG